MAASAKRSLAILFQCWLIIVFFSAAVNMNIRLGMSRYAACRSWLQETHLLKVQEQPLLGMRSRKLPFSESDKDNRFDLRPRAAECTGKSD